MTIFLETLSNIITIEKEKVYTFPWIFFTIGVPAKPLEWSGCSMEWNCHLSKGDLQDYAWRVLGAGCLVDRVSKMHGGAQKVVYKIDFRNGFSCVLYVWDLSMNYFQEDIVREGIHEASYGCDLLEINNKYLTERGVRTPALYDRNTERNPYPFDYALVEYIEGQKAEAYFRHSDSRVQDRLFQQVGDMIATMHSTQRNTPGRANQRGRAAWNCHLEQFENAKVQLSYACEYIDSFRVNQNKLLDILCELESRIQPRTEYGFIHGELEPDHILVNDRLEPYLIDIEGAMFFDIEQEHSFLEFRFGDFYCYLKNDHLDPDRMLFYRYHHHISLTSGGLKLLHRGFPDQQFAKQLAAHHSQCALRFIERGF